MTANHMSNHRKMALLNHFAPCEVLEDSTTPANAVFPTATGRLHFWGHLNGVQVDVMIKWGGAFNEPIVNCCTLEPVGAETLSATTLEREIDAVLRRTI